MRISRRMAAVPLLLALTAGCSGGDGFLDMFDTPVPTATPATPFAQPDAYIADENMTLFVPAALGVLANDLDDDSPEITAQLASMTTNGTVNLAADGSFSYTPASGFFGDDGFTYVANDGDLSSEPTTVSLRVDRGFLIDVDPVPIDLVQGSSATITVSVTAIDSVLPPPVVTVTLADVPAGLVVTPVEVTAGTPGILTIETTLATPQFAWSSRSIEGTLGPKSVAAPLQLRIRGGSGALDTTLGGGFLRFDLDGESVCNAVAVQPDGKIVLGGLRRLPSSGKYHHEALRLLSDGSLDTSFDSDGQRTFQLGDFGAIAHVFLLPAGKILFGGWGIDVVGASNATTMIRLDTNGALDSTFGNAGVQNAVVSGGSVDNNAMAIRPDGRILQAGRRGNSSPVPAFLGGFNSNGSPFTSFGPNGFDEFYFDGSESTTIAGLATDSSNGAVVVGRASVAGAGIARFTASGDLDTSFSGDGVMTFLAGTQSGATSAVFLPGGNLLVGVHRTLNGQTDMLALQLEPDGTPVASFGSDGALVIDGGASEFAWLSRDRDERVLFVGIGDAGILAGRYALDGTSDTSFNGAQPYRVYPDGDAVRSYIPSSSAFDPDGRIVVCGSSSGADVETQMFVMRVWP